MKELPILFSRPMVRAILKGRKGQTRRIVRDAPAVAGCARYVEPQSAEWKGWSGAVFFAGPTPESQGLSSVRFPYGKVGDRLWVRETWCDTLIEPADDARVVDHLDEHGYTFTAYRADDWLECPAEDGRWRPAIHMPRFRSRLLLDVLSVRVERLQDISEADAQREGWDLSNIDVYQTYDPVQMDSARQWFRGLWDSINGERAPWAANPWVWVVEFKRATP